MGPSWDHPFVRESHVQDNVTQMQHDQEDIPVKAVHEEPPIVALNLSPTAQDFAASGGVLPVDAEAIVPVSVHPSPSKVQVNHEVASLTFFLSLPYLGSIVFTLLSFQVWTWTWTFFYLSILV
jgi:hypothetical protein